MSNICCIFNLAAVYREPIYRLLDTKLDCDFYITKWRREPFKQMDYNKLSGYKKSGYKIDLVFGFYWQTNTICLVFKRYNVYVITGEPYSVSNWLILVLAKFLGKKTIVWSHGWYGRENLVKFKVKKTFFNLSSIVLLYGEYAKGLMKEIGFNTSKLHCIYNSLDYNNQLRIRAELTLGDDFKKHFGNNLPVIMFLGRIQKSKKISLIFDAMALLFEQGIYLNAVIVGGTYGEELEFDNLKNSNLSEHVWFYGPTFSESIIGNFLYNSIVCVSPGNVGLLAIHSLTYGTPVITHNNFLFQGPEFEAIKDGVTGSFFIQDSIEDLASKIRFWIGLSPADRNRTREQCYSIVDLKYNPEVQYKKIKEAIDIVQQL